MRGVETQSRGLSCGLLAFACSLSIFRDRFVCRQTQPKGVPRRFTPILMGVREEAIGGAYTLVLEFAKRKEMPVEDFTSRQDKFQSFFGPGVTAEVQETDQARHLHPAQGWGFCMSSKGCENTPFLMCSCLSMFIRLEGCAGRGRLPEERRVWCWEGRRRAEGRAPAADAWPARPAPGVSRLVGVQGRGQCDMLDWHSR